MTITDPTLYMTPDERRAEHQRRLDEARKWFDELPPLPTAAEVVRPIIAELLRLHDLRERVEVHVAALESYEFTDVTDDDWQAAHALLALQHEIADLLALEMSGWATGGRRLGLGAALRAVLYEAMDTETLVYACRYPQIDGIRMSVGESLSH